MKKDIEAGYSVEVLEQSSPGFQALPSEEQVRRRKLLADGLTGVLDPANKLTLQEASYTTANLLELHLTGKIDSLAIPPKTPRRKRRK